MAEDDRLPLAPVLVIDVDVSSVFFSYGYVWHSNFSFLLVVHYLSHRCGSSINCLKLSRYSLALEATMEESKTERNFRVTMVAFSERGSNETTPSPTPSAIVRQTIRRSGIWRMTSISPRCSLRSRIFLNEKCVSSIRSTLPSDLINFG